MATTARFATLTRLAKQDEGIGLILVIGISAMMAILLAVITTTAIRSLGSSSDHVNFEQSLAAAESGVDSELSSIQEARNQVPSVTYESPASCRPATPSAGVFASEASEKAWARASLKALPSSCVKTNAQGEYVAFKVPGRQIVYSLGWSPSRSATNAKERLLKVEYIFAPYRPGKALLTGGDLDFSGSVAINAIAGLPADVHTNSSATGIGDSLNVSGSISASGTVNSCTSKVLGGCETGVGKERIPPANPRAVYTEFASTTGQWYDLCNDGTVRSPATTGPLVPCTGAQIATSPYRGWYWTAGNATTPGTWTLQSTGTSYPGVYYVYGANAQLGANGNSNVLQTVSVLAESTYPSGFTNAATCNKYGGNINWKLFDLQNYLRGVVFIAQGNLVGTANSSAQSGLMLAGDKVDLQTSSASVQGSVIANNTCAAAGTNTVQGMQITYDDSVEAPVYSVVNTTLWLEYTG
jgi:Tfp pilus assembly protein PilX